MNNNSGNQGNNQPNRNVPLNQMMMQQQQIPQQMSYGYPAAGQQTYQYAQPGYQQPQQSYQQPQSGYGAPMGGYGQPIAAGASVLAPGMLNPVAPRKAIPDAASAGKLSLFCLLWMFRIALQS